ncbi:Periplasmic pH-dependent serine endoprotease DegQ [BD1-7 clade bacterium]|uniref:Periplasmic pH-dependent serine endoprotease DegQ n=1 Tax=BD1-7 clade bacterium TaxID=2029982 RepID=A0A5S9NJ28_9GAMM|nr:Periplasmic pH-dependent serine endoprotease DegQ [BD1-7 clade bacterium]CAA0093246.1 Periplasmic pH-dependent serine endoprotease DegQ [BD1-7 clade bacterium]
MRRWPVSLLTFWLLLFVSLHSQAALPVTDSDGNQLPTLAPIIKKTTPAVVNIATSSTRRVNHPLLNDPTFREYYRIPPNYQAPERKTQSTGSGVVIIGKEGVIITNHHVVEGAENIEVILHNGDTLTAKLIGSDPEVDIAVLKVDSSKLQDIPLANSSLLDVGDFVIAIGNPFGLNQTVTTGIVSALGRSGLGIEGYEDFIQTDASINPGNSGGALINLRGELIGINTAILAPGRGGNVGIGFAIPIDMAMSSVEQILTHGEVKRGQIGVVIQDIDKKLQQAFALPSRDGILVSRVMDDSSAQAAGIKDADVIQAVDEQPVKNVAQLRNAIGSRRIGDKVKLTILRSGKLQRIDVTIGGKAIEPGKFALNTNIGKKLDGVQFRETSDNKGLRISNIQPNSAAAETGLQKGDIIISANRKSVNSVNDLRKIISKDEDQLLLHVIRGRSAFFVVIQ